MTRRLAIAVVPLALGWSVDTVPGSGERDEQVAAEAAVAVFSERISDAGWVSLGPPPQEESGELPEDRPLGECFSGFDVVVLENTERRLEGETARAYSDNFRVGDFDPDSTDPVPDEGYIAIGVFTVTDSSVAVLDEIVTMLGDAETVACLTRPGNEQGDTVTNVDDIGVGDTSARLDLSYAVDDGGQVTESVLASRVDRSLVTMVVYTGGEFQLDLDPVTELAAVVDALSDSSP
jgi:hypothetical protein